MANPTPEHYRQLCEWLTQKSLEIFDAKTFVLQKFNEACQFAHKGGVVEKW